MNEIQTDNLPALKGSDYPAERKTNESTTKIVRIQTRQAYEQVLREVRNVTRCLPCPPMGYYYVDKAQGHQFPNADLCPCLGVLAIDHRSDQVLNAHLISGPISPNNLERLYHDKRRIESNFLVRLHNILPSRVRDSTRLHDWMESKMWYTKESIERVETFANVLKVIEGWVLDSEQDFEKVEVHVFGMNYSSLDAGENDPYHTLTTLHRSEVLRDLTMTNATLHNHMVPYDKSSNDKPHHVDQYFYDPESATIYWYHEG